MNLVQRFWFGSAARACSSLLGGTVIPLFFVARIQNDVGFAVRRERKLDEMFFAVFRFGQVGKYGRFPLHIPPIRFEG